MAYRELRGWNHIVYTILKNYLNNGEFKLHELYEFEPHFKVLYPANNNVKEKLRQTLQNLRDKGLLEFLSRGVYKLLPVDEVEVTETIDKQELVYLLSNDSIPGWVKIGRTNQVDRRLSELYNTSVPLPFKLEDTIHTNSLKQSSELERSIHSIIDTINPDLRKNTEANRREFFKLSIDQGKQVFNLVSKIMKINPLEFEGDYHGTSIRSNKA